ncbi:LysM peptidoglycan-binding domain-containing protein [Microbacterium sp. CFH 90308]|uniref:LysM peptidoglycan-binding domain-containing protein n=1 Tax=Microbacterium salsuginis TaxID=2722803 RepID=A0ABX1KHI2_9MICO|nr:LysM peptidoglycan-binding domain-containing protein [Microbacterium sp. CFH 90308]NLP85942.1 LysM peptidoglycan-binding domain-containing protein [Microbacterium sp. CFH 90308]
MAVVGSIALSLTTAPAHAAPGSAEPRTTPDRAVSGIRPHAMKSAVAGAAVVAAADQNTYTVQAGDTVSAIASRFGVRTADLLALNNLGWKSIIYPGQVLTLVGGAAAAPAAPAAAPAPAASYTIQHGDTVSAIAKRHGVSTQAMLAANGLGWSSIIYPGQTLAIPGSAAPAAAPTPAPAPVTAPAPAVGGSYTIIAGDTISAIAKRHGVSTDAVLGANGLDRSSIIYPGQTIAIPIAAVAAAAPATPAIPGLDAEQVANAQLIVRVGRELGVPDRGIAIALGTAMQESWIRNLDWGDRDSLGLFQQRPSTGWGTEAEVRDPVRAIKAFYGGASDPNGSRTRGLLDIAGWQSMSFADAAQAVQISAYPERYAQWEAPAHAWLAALG